MNNSLKCPFTRVSPISDMEQFHVKLDTTAAQIWRVFEQQDQPLEYLPASNKR